MLEKFLPKEKVRMSKDVDFPSDMPLVLIAAGGTGGHLFPAEALANILVQLGVRVVLASDERISHLAAEFPAEEIIAIPSATPSTGSVFSKIMALISLAHGLLVSWFLLRRLKPVAVIGFGGYPTVPPLLAAVLKRIPTLIHEQNSVMGRANRFLSGRVTNVATGFPNVQNMPASIAGKAVYTGNPVRPAVLKASETIYPPALKGGKMRLLVFGGSQGARIFGDVVPKALNMLSIELQRRVVVTQQVRGEDLLKVRSSFSKNFMQFDIQPFFKDLPQRIADAHLIIARSGASTVAELAAIGRPSILVPLQSSLDGDQAANAVILEEAGAATVIPQEEFTPQRLFEEIKNRFDSPDSLTKAANVAKTKGIRDAAQRLAALVIGLGRINIKGV